MTKSYQQKNGYLFQEFKKKWGDRFIFLEFIDLKNR
jgi:hypothetical protein